MKKAILILLMHLAIAHIAVLIFSLPHIHSFKDYIISLWFSGSISVCIWSGVILLLRILDRIMPLDSFFIYRFVAETILMAIHSVVSIYLISLFFFKVIWNIDFLIADNYQMFTITMVCFFVVFFFINSINFMMRWKTSFQRTEDLEKRQLALEYESLKTQMSPHFLFNSLNSLTALIEIDQTKAVAFVKKLSNLYRYILDSKHKQLVSLSDEICFAEDYIALQEIRFGNAIQFTNTIDEAKTVQIVPLALQIMLENALKHNIVSASKPLHISLSIDGEYIIISNTYQPKHQDTAGKGIGLNNILELYGHLTSKSLITRQDEGLFTVQIPII